MRMCLMGATGRVGKPRRGAQNVELRHSFVSTEVKTSNLSFSHDTQNATCTYLQRNERYQPASHEKPLQMKDI